MAFACTPRVLLKRAEWLWSSQEVQPGRRVLLPRESSTDRHPKVALALAANQKPTSCVASGGRIWEQAVLGRLSAQRFPGSGLLQAWLIWRGTWQRCMDRHAGAFLCNASWRGWLAYASFCIGWQGPTPEFSKGPIAATCEGCPGEKDFAVKQTIDSALSGVGGAESLDVASTANSPRSANYLYVTISCRFALRRLIARQGLVRVKSFGKLQYIWGVGAWYGCDTGGGTRAS